MPQPHNRQRFIQPPTVGSSSVSRYSAPDNQPTLLGTVKENPTVGNTVGAIVSWIPSVAEKIFIAGTSMWVGLAARDAFTSKKPFSGQPPLAPFSEKNGKKGDLPENPEREIEKLVKSFNKNKTKNVDKAMTARNLVEWLIFRLSQQLDWISDQLEKSDSEDLHTWKAAGEGVVSQLQKWDDLWDWLSEEIQKIKYSTIDNVAVERFDRVLKRVTS